MGMYDWSDENFRRFYDIGCKDEFPSFRTRLYVSGNIWWEAIQGLPACGSFARFERYNFDNHPEDVDVMITTWGLFHPIIWFGNFCIIKHPSTGRYYHISSVYYVSTYLNKDKAIKAMGDFYNKSKSITELFNQTRSRNEN